MSLRGRLKGWLGSAGSPPPPEATAREKRKAFEEALRVDDFGALRSIIGTQDPYRHGALFIAVDHMLEAGKKTSLGALADLVDPEDRFAQKVWEALTAWYLSDRTAIDRLRALQTDRRVPASQRDSGPAWAVYARAPRFVPGPASSPADGPADGPGPAIMQFWDKREVPEDLVPLTAQWKALAGDRYHLFDAQTASDYLRDAYGPAEAATFEACPHPAIQCDYFRLGYIAREGGMYLDTDARMRPGFAELWPAMADRTILWFRTHVPRGMFNNGILIAKPGMRLLHDTFVDAARRLRDTPNAHVLSLAGPVTLRSALIRLDAAGQLDPIETMTSTFAKTRIFSQAHAAYKEDDRDWKAWQRTRQPT